MHPTLIHPQCGHTGSARVVVLIQGSVLVGVDLSTARFEQIDPIKHTAILIRPSPRVIEAKLDMTNTRVVAIEESGLWRFVPSSQAVGVKLVALATQQAQQQLERTSHELPLNQQAKERAERVIREFQRRMGWEIQISWNDRPGR